MITGIKPKSDIEILEDRVKDRMIHNSFTYGNPAFSDASHMKARGRMDEDQWMLDQIKELSSVHTG